MAVVTPLTACFATSSIVFNTWSVFVVPVCDTFGTSTGSFAWYVSIIYLASAIAAPIAGSLVQKHDVRFIYTAAVALCAVFIGVLYGTTNSVGPSVTRNLFGTRDYSVIYSRIAVVVNIIPVAFIPFYAFLADTSWDLLFGVGAGILVLIFACSVATLYFGKRLVQTEE